MDQYHWNANDQQSQEYDATSKDLLDSKHQIKQQLIHKITKGTRKFSQQQSNGHHSVEAHHQPNHNEM